MKPIIYFSTLCILLSLCLSKAHAAFQSNKRITAKSAIAKIKALPEVKRFMQYAKKSKPMLELESEPDSTNKYYCFALGVSNLDMFRTSTRYFVDAITGKIFVDDSMNVSNDDTEYLVSLQQFRHWGRTKGWGKPHIFVNGKLVVVKNKSRIN